jgi:hypothetical protein
VKPRNRHGPTRLSAMTALRLGRSEHSAPTVHAQYTRCGGNCARVVLRWWPRLWRISMSTARSTMLVMPIRPLKADLHNASGGRQEPPVAQTKPDQHIYRTCAVHYTIGTSMGSQKCFGEGCVNTSWCEVIYYPANRCHSRFYSDFTCS